MGVSLELGIVLFPPLLVRAYAPGILRTPPKYRRQSGLACESQARALLRIASPTARGWGFSPFLRRRLNRRAATPDTIGVAKLLPVNEAVPPGTAPGMLSPGARTPFFL